MTTVTAVIDTVDTDRPGRPDRSPRPQGRPVRLVPATAYQDQPEPPEPAGLQDPVDRARTRPTNCRFAMHFED
ncbi:hypothetical protein AB0O91_14000 [Kitasatospora sp. NPDC089797]|uniref:hypothetical protein n=1 Tax=Kitasatospora sp. NPDC089797 TaxID=3155298 RepID=UPI003449ACFA